MAIERLAKLTPEAFESLKILGRSANDVYTDAIKAMGGVIDPASPLAAREAALGVTPTLLNFNNLPTGNQLSKSSDLGEISKTLLSNNLGFFDKTVGARGKKGLNWYGDAQKEARLIGTAAGFKGQGKQEDVGAALLAALSPKTLWSDNIAMGRRAAVGLRQGEIQKLMEDMLSQGVTNFEDARQAGILIPPSAKKLNPKMFTKLISIMDTGTGKNVLKNYDEGIKIDSFYGAIRLSPEDRRFLISKGVMDENERILQPDYVYKGIRLGDISTKPVIDKFDAVQQLGASGLGYAYPLTTIDTPIGYNIFADALSEAARRRNRLTPDFQSMKWVQLHDLYPKNVESLPKTIEESLKAYEKTGQVPPALMKQVRDALAKGELGI